MTVEIKVPSVGESISEVTIDQWLKKEGEAIERDKTLAVLESEKATVELPAEATGTVTKILKKPGDTAQVGETIAIIDTDARPTVSATQTAAPQPSTPAKAKAAAPPRPEEPPPMLKNEQVVKPQDTPETTSASPAASRRKSF